MKNKILCIFTLLMLCAATVVAQTIKVKGTIVAMVDGEPLMGATVKEVGGTKGTVADMDGNFTIEVPAKSTLQFSYVGFAPQTVKARSVMNIQLEEDNILNEMVVTGYTIEKKADLTGSVAVVDTKDLKTAADPDPIRALQGKLPGVTIKTDGSPSGTGSIQIRGTGSFNASTAPLIVIDGMPTTQSLNSLNTADIESMQILKDAASASIYGSRAANGVIIITTKKGKDSDGKVKVDFNANWTAQTYNSQTRMKLLNSTEYATALAQAALNDGMDPVVYAQKVGLNLNAETGKTIQAWDPATNAYKNYTVNGLYDGYLNNREGHRIPFGDTDWLDAISRTGFIQNYDATVSRATDRGTMLVSLGYKRNDGILKYTNFENLSARMNSSFKINKIVTVGENFTVTHTNQVGGAPMGEALKMGPHIPIYEEDGKTFSGPVAAMRDRQNPLRILHDEKDNGLDIWRLFGNGYIDIKPVKGLLIHSSFGIDYDACFRHGFDHTFDSDIVKNAIAKTDLSQANDMRWNWTSTATYNIDFCDVHHLQALVGYEMYKRTRKEFSAHAEGFDYETTNYMWPNAATGIKNVGGYQSGFSLISLFGKLDYNWDERLLASFTIRRDGSSRFGKNCQYATFPAATLGYRISRDIKGAESWLDDLKIRASWGKTGNQDIADNARWNLFAADYGSDRVIATAYNLTLQNTGTLPSGYRTTQAANGNLKWETTTQYNAGLDFAFLNQRLYGSVDMYIKKITDMLINPAYLASLGEGGASWANGPSLKNWGTEIQIGWRDNLACGFGYKINGNLDFFRNKVTYLPLATTGSYVHTTRQNLVEAGKPYGSIVGYICDGLYQSHEEALASGQQNAREGGLKYRDLNGDGTINAEDETWIFNPVPNFSYGLNFEFTYKGFDLTMFWQGVAGQDVWNTQKFQTDFWSVDDSGSNKGRRVLDAWTTANRNSSIPALTTENNAREDHASTYFVENGSYLKLRTLQLGYTLPKKWISKIKMDHARVYVSGQNLLTIKSKSLTCTDPENPGFAYPRQTSFTFGLQVGF